MKNLRLLFTLLFVAAFASYSFGQITGSEHDFSGETWSGGEICIACHTPHNAMATGPVLWNRNNTTTVFTVYTSGTLDATDVTDPAGSSRLCLSCHDGTIALENFGGATGGTTFVLDPFGNDISGDHPISFGYTTALATLDGELNDPSVASSGLGGTIAADLLIGDNLECASCHDVHNAEGNVALLRLDNAGSALCLTCHAK